MLAGRLRHRVTIQANTPTTDEWGKANSWGTVDTVWAEVIPTGGSEAMKDKGIQASGKFTVKMRYRADVSPENRLVFKGRTLDIASVVNVDERNRELVIECAEHQTVTA